MSLYGAMVEWHRADGAAFTNGRYSRGHLWRFDGGAEVSASSSPHSVKLPYSVEENVDPEEAFVAALASCHMLFFLSLAAKHGFVVDTYRDDAEGTLATDADGRIAMTRVVLSPRVAYAGDRPDRAAEAGLHHEAHELCFIANSVKTVVELRLD